MLGAIPPDLISIIYGTALVACGGGGGGGRGISMKANRYRNLRVHSCLGAPPQKMAPLAMFQAIYGSLQKLPGVLC